MDDGHNVTFSIILLLEGGEGLFFMGHGPSRARLLIGFRKSSGTFLQSAECVGPPMLVNLLSLRSFYVIWKTIGFFF